MDRRNKPKYKLGISLSGGGARGFAHLGALKALEERNICPDVLAGTSVGALIAVLYADGYRTDEILSIADSIKFTSIAESAIPRGGFFKSTGIQSILNKYLRVKTFEELQIPVHVIASDIEKGCIRDFCAGEIIPAVMASCSVPLVFIPVEIEESHYVDGGLLMNFPVSVIREDCDKIIGINVSPVISMEYTDSFKYVIERVMNYMVGANTNRERDLCDYLIESEAVSTFSLFDFKHGDEIYEIGYRMASEYLYQNKEKIQNDLFLPEKKPFRHKLADFILSLKSKK